MHVVGSWVLGFESFGTEMHKAESSSATLANPGSAAEAGFGRRSRVRPPNLLGQAVLAA